MSKTKYCVVLCVGALAVAVIVRALVDHFAAPSTGFIASVFASGVWGGLWGIVGGRKLA